ncbi:NADPH-dependent FMN reductase [Sphingobacterium chuzhouense]|uniref:NAD(P)H-dependent oxidoreductase n=1 Tax=Sphingobacterium chuzhouense TaxID=1742264 RepID=A0ABR7XTW1_9SPHI|nr:NAD(P)H-dependent oxidoreductase [Sphingobacterium chuzhouense]MBD1421757.1 NAD(P)H-dependent oxidoreductase [Sphingobacterium chuzhouense]
MNILAFAASNSSTSINKKFVTSVSKYYKEPNDVIEIIDLHDFEAPLFSEDCEKTDGIPSTAYDLAKKIDEADFILVSFAEHNGNYSAAYKNITDWVSRIPGRKIYNGKPLFIMATSNGKRGGQSVLDIAANRLAKDGADILEIFSLPQFSENFEDGKGVTNVTYRSQLEAKVRKTKRILKQKLD